MDCNCGHINYVNVSKMVTTYVGVRVLKNKTKIILLTKMKIIIV